MPLAPRHLAVAVPLLLLSACGNKEATLSFTAPASTSGSAMGAITGRVLSAAGTPVADCSVTPEPTSTPRPAVPEMAATTGPDGRYHWPLPPGTYVLTAHCTAGSKVITASTRPIPLAPGDRVTADITLP